MDEETTKEESQILDIKIRRTFDEKSKEWYFSIVDVVGTVTNSTDARNYWKVLKNRFKNGYNEKYRQLVTRCNQLKMLAKDGKAYLTDVADQETILQIIASITPSKIEFFKSYFEELKEEDLRIELAKKEDLPSPVKLLLAHDKNMGAELLIDMYQKDADIWIEAFIAGVAVSEINISVTSKKITIEGKCSQLESIPENKYLHQELIWTNFYRAILLPCKIRASEVEASEKDGHLFIRLPKV
ncbi:MAG: Hsp20/alpha crystallin family protein [Candidatus Paceibacterota bacterium]